MALFKILRGPSTSLGEQNKVDGYCYFTPDTRMFYIDYADGDNGLVRKPLNADDARTLLGKGVVEELLNDADNVPTAAAVFEYIEEVEADLIAEIAKKMDKVNQTIEAFDENVYTAIGMGDTNANFSVDGVLVSDWNSQEARMNYNHIDINNDMGWLNLRPDKMFLSNEDGDLTLSVLEIKQETVDGGVATIAPEQISLESGEHSIFITPESIEFSGSGIARITGLATPTADSEAANKAYVDSKAFSGDYNALTNKPAIPTTAADVDAVPTTRKINNKALSADITLSAADVGAIDENGGYVYGDLTFQSQLTGEELNISATEINFENGATVIGANTITFQHSLGDGIGMDAEGGRISGLSDPIAAYDAANKNYVDGNKVPMTRTINGKALSSNVVLTAEDVGAMSSTNPTGTGSFSLNRKADTTVGEYSVAEGLDNTASGQASHAEGNITIASGINAHSEGFATQATAFFAHAEGDNTKATAQSAHAEGSASVASAGWSHAEGAATQAHSEGSHTEGWKTDAWGEYQHVQGKYNIEDVIGIYAHIVGNGDTTRSNAHTLDWSGNAWFAGGVYVGSTSGTNKDSGSLRLSPIVHGTATIADGAASSYPEGTLYVVIQ